MSYSYFVIGFVFQIQEQTVFSKILDLKKCILFFVITIINCVVRYLFVRIFLKLSIAHYLYLSKKTHWFKNVNTIILERKKFVIIPLNAIFLGTT